MLSVVHNFNLVFLWLGKVLFLCAFGKRELMLKALGGNFINSAVNKPQKIPYFSIVSHGILVKFNYILWPFCKVFFRGEKLLKIMQCIVSTFNKHHTRDLPSFPQFPAPHPRKMGGFFSGGVGKLPVKTYTCPGGVGLFQTSVIY